MRNVLRGGGCSFIETGKQELSVSHEEGGSYLHGIHEEGWRRVLFESLRKGAGESWNIGR